MSNIVKKQNDDTFDKIQKYYHENGKLSEKEKEICERWERAFAILCETKIRAVAIKKYIATFPEGISVPAAYRDFKAAEEIFAPMQKYSKEFLRMVIIESAMREIDECEQMILKANEPDAKTYTIKEWATIKDVKDKAEKRIISASGLKYEDLEKFDFSKLQPHTFEIGVDENIQALFAKMLAKGAVDISEAYKMMSTEAEFEELSDEDED